MVNRVKQLSIFLENKAGSLNEIFEILGGANIRIIASTLSDTTDYGILRLITSDSEAAHTLLQQQRKNSVVKDLFALECDSTAGSLYNIMHRFTADGLSVEYMYCFTSQQRTVTILRLNDNDAAVRSIVANGFKSLSDEDLCAM